MKLSKISQKLVVNAANGEVLGYVHDVDFEVPAYHIRSFVVEEKPGIMEKVMPWFFQKKTISVAIENIETIGSDVILIRVKNK